jgi:hypothetical protein
MTRWQRQSLAPGLHGGPSCVPAPDTVCVRVSHVSGQVGHSLGHMGNTRTAMCPIVRTPKGVRTGHVQSAAVNDTRGRG